MVRPIQVRSRADLEKLALELEGQYTVVFSDDDHLLAMKDGRIVKRFRTMRRNPMADLRGSADVAGLPSAGHVFLMYDELHTGTELEARLLMAGLLNGERCLYATHQDAAEAERSLSEGGLPVNEFKTKKLIKVLKIEDPFQDGGEWSPAVGRIVRRILSYGPDRIVSWRWIRDLTDPRQVAANKAVERLVNAAIQGESIDPSFQPLRNFGGLFVCSYLIGGSVPEPPKLDWLANHLASHDATILAGRTENVLLSNRSR
jgi:hypothetical protein